MGIWWVTFDSGKSACYEGTREEVELRTAQSGTVKSIDCLPYPAEPRTDPKGDCPSFCYTPERCKGRTSCPKNYACSE